MATVSELSDGYANFMLSPRPGRGVCDVCFNLTDGWSRCFACSHLPACLAAVAPVSYSVGREQLHHALAAYKRLSGPPAQKLRLELAAVLWRHLASHERCVARAAHVARFAVVTTVPAGAAERDAVQPLRELVARHVEPVRERYERLLTGTADQLLRRRFDPRRFSAKTKLAGEAVLLIDDTWTTGASAQSAAAALLEAGAGCVAAVVVGRHVTRDWGENDRRLRALESPFDWRRCPYCGSG